MSGGSNLEDPIIKAIVSSRVKLLLEKPFFGTLATRLSLEDGSAWCKTAATDGKRFFYNREFIKSLTQPQLLFLMGHEVLHCVYDHLGRRGQRDPKIWNMANDYIVNYTLVKENCGKMPDGGLYDEKYHDGMTSEEVYNILIANSVTIKMTLDEHLDPDASGSDGEGDGEGSPGGEVSVTVMGKDGPPKLTEEEMQKIRNEIRAATIQAAQAVGAGKVPAGVARMIAELTEPKMDWRALLETHVKSSVKDDYTFQKMSRRSHSLKAFLPAMSYLNTVDIAVAIDTSGSMTDKMLLDFLSEVKGIMELFQDFKLTLWTFDTEVHNPKLFTGDNLDEILEYDPQGGGGTTFAVNWEYMKAEGLEPQRLVMFTDGYDSGDNGLQHADYVDTLFVIHGRNQGYEPGFGIVAYYDEKE